MNEHIPKGDSVVCFTRRHEERERRKRATMGMPDEEHPLAFAALYENGSVEITPNTGELVDPSAENLERVANMMLQGALSMFRQAWGERPSDYDETSDKLHGVPCAAIVLFATGRVSCVLEKDEFSAVEPEIQAGQIKWLVGQMRAALQLSRRMAKQLHDEAAAAAVEQDEKE